MCKTDWMSADDVNIAFVLWYYLHRIEVYSTKNSIKWWQIYVNKKKLFDIVWHMQRARPHTQTSKWRENRTSSIQKQWIASHLRMNFITYPIGRVDMPNRTFAEWADSKMNNSRLFYFIAGRVCASISIALYTQLWKSILKAVKFFFFEQP